MRLILDARTASFAALIDDAGLFPPASRDMATALSTYRRIRASPARWVAGRFLCPASRLEELAGVMMATFRAGEQPWEVGVVFDAEPGPSASLAQTFHAEMQPAAVIASAEAAPGTGDAVSLSALVDTLVSIQPEVVPFVEVDLTRPIKEQIDTVADELAKRGRVGGVKLRCGGAEASMFPDPATIASFIASSTDAKLPFKAAAGLHRPIRNFDPGLGIWHHGFINILVAAAAADAGHPPETMTDIIAETDAAAFRISTAFVTWRDLSIPGPAMRRVRTRGFVGFGSSDFFAPIEALEDLAFLGDGS